MDNRPSMNANNRRLMKIGRRVFLAGVVATASGCQNMIHRAQSPDDRSLFRLTEEEADTTNYIGDICGIYGMKFAKIHGVGIVVDLDGTGSPSKSNSQREHLIRELEFNKNIDDAKSLVASQDTELVILEGLLPPGIRAGDKFDLEVVAMGNTEATSIENGLVLQTRMRPMKWLGRGVKEGHLVALANGRVFVDSLFETRDGKEQNLKGIILGGGKALENRPLGLTIRTDAYTQKTTTQMARAINARFTVVSPSGRKGVSEPKTDRQIELVVPENYSNNIGRYMGVIQNIAYSESADDLVNRMEALDSEIGNPSQAAVAALRLEAIGKAGFPALKRALRHHDLEVQFHAAQSLAYSGQADGLEVLKRAAKEEPAFRWHALTALSTLDDISSASALADLMHVESAETRYGAFRALRAQSPNDPTVSGEWLAGDFFLHEVVSDANPMLHFSRAKRPEIVVFGDRQTVADDFLFVESGLTVKGIGNGKISVKRYSAEFGEKTKICSTRVGDLIRTLAGFGFGYSDLMKMFQDANKSDSVNTRIVINAVPRLGRKYQADELVGDLTPEKSRKYVALPMPELFRFGSESDNSLPRVSEKTVGQNVADEKRRTESRWKKMKRWFVAGKEE